MKKLPKPFLTALPLLLLLAACSNDDDNNEGINGRWDYAGYYNNIQDVFYPIQECESRVMTLKSKGMGLTRINDCEHEVNVTFTWEKLPETDTYSFINRDFEPETVKITLSAASDSLFVQSISNSRFTDVYKRQ